MFTLKIENKSGSVFTLTQNESDYQVYSIEGLNPPNAIVNTSNITGMDGTLFNSSKLESRNIVMMIKINGDVEANRLELYKYFRTKELCKIYYKNGARDVFIEGYVETFEVNHFENFQFAQISIICPDPYFKDVNTIVNDISKVINNFGFPFSINETTPIPISSIEIQKATNISNTSESETGINIDIAFKGSIESFEIINTTTGDTMTIVYSFVNGDALTINTHKGSKSLTLIRNGEPINMIPYLVKGSTFFQLVAGDNIFTYATNDPSKDAVVSIIFKYYNIYRGV